MAESTIGVAIHGAGDVAHAHALSWMKNPRARLVSISSRTPQSAQSLAERLGVVCDVRHKYDEVLADPRVNVVDICSPNHAHAQQGIAAAEAGKHIFVEKPMAMSLDECRDLRDAVAAAGVKSIVGFVLRWNPLFTVLKRQLADGAVGELFFAEVDYWHGIGPGFRKQWQWFSRKETAGSTALLAGCHAIDALRYLTGEEAVEVSAYSNNKKENFEYDANYVAVMKLASGTIAKSSTLLDCEMPYTFNIDLAGTKGTIRDNRIWSPEKMPGQTSWATVPTILPDSGDVHHHAFDAQMNHFIECIDQDRDSHCNVADGYRTHELCLAIDRSIEEGGAMVRLPLE
ncbi:MAG: Gfo/Idh/MocA family oxidoreductase [Planctomycetota bacterium]|nr:Gfo/Idh/MocA family oxidoreductase [Planctomycetota bacterium]